ncbi:MULTISPECIES: DNA-deoxyinosine glycosylase [unclassified Undibacterium]|uniref:DNA-deoxyinosine glycosylase n=1 Tax=unclassified Undibacterium TaxID=2630295 RepID=UPI002AC8F9CF|nr:MULTISPECIES: DNA-deoxyinosine glycosylase [unclassified Undibacterium]MEB0138176.1 DNA-deoxyinosine glycosylase [Undibacterium sp. CCC2.1]MEB0171069.1 DNA-deoxyinosine glycosylase [Undibacterium sp. CCC1.1]MEB0175114.1 DNA-deoxyinosine glycosylase [Undibacterium sp. CCC3.4]MEB0214302.1 DNA-deoxyinosine glycosylase [Undibacterium sp. 5I2]WPX41882.1 DNA-deoxyinosine glycosylase [Undibacterium sp. CCC3.4]
MHRRPAALPPDFKRCFEPVIDAGTRLLILGSLPGEQSLMRNEYYGNKQNRFWQLVGAVIDAELHQLPYPDKLATLLRHGIGLWDVVAQAQRAGSLDSQIRARDDNDLLGLLAQHPGITSIAFNGGTAAKLGLRVLGAQAAHYRIVALPSSSPAYTLAYANKLAAWLALRGF